MGRPSHAAGLASPARHRLTGTAIPDDGGPKVKRSRGGVFEKKTPAAGPVPKSGSLRLTKRKGVETRPTSVETSGVVLKKDVKTAVDEVSRRRSITPREGKRPWKCYMGMEEVDPSARVKESPRGIRVNYSPSPSRQRRAESLASQRRSRSESAPRPPYSLDTDTDVVTPRRSRLRQCTSSPGNTSSLRADIALYSANGECKPQGRNRGADRPAEVDVFTKVATTPIPPTSKLVAKERNNTRSACRERPYLPTNYTASGNQPSKQEGGMGNIRNPGAARTNDSLVNAWSITAQAPLRKQFVGMKRQDGAGDSVPAPWGVQKRNSLTRYHRKGSFELNRSGIAPQKAAKSSKRQQLWGAPNAAVRSDSCGSIRSLGSGQDTPRSGRRMYSQEARRTIPGWTS